jgi:hypothetical protein
VIRRRRVQCVRQVAPGRHPEERGDPSCLDLPDRRADVGGGDHQLADESLEIADERLLVGEELRNVDALEIDGALQAAHEGLRAGGQLVEPVAQRPEGPMYLGLVRLLRLAERRQLAKQAADVAQRGALQLAVLRERRLVGRQRALGRLPLRRELEEVPGPVELLDRRHVGRVGMRLEVAPLAQRRQRSFDGGDVNRLGQAKGSEGYGDVRRPQVERKAGLGVDEDAHHGAVERCLVGVDVGEGSEPAGCVGHRRCV